MAVGVIWLQLVSGSGRCTVFLAPEGLEREPAFARGAGRRLVHLERNLPTALLPSLHAMAESLARATEQADDTLVPRLLAAADATGASAQLLRVTSVEQSLPRWATTLRGGFLAVGSGRFWPARAEEIALDLGLRDAIKREGLSAEELTRSRRLFDAEGLSTAVCSGVLLVARDQVLLARLVEAEIELRRGGTSHAAAAFQLGMALGYPKCCIEVFGRLGSADDLSLAAGLLPPLRHAPASPLAQWLIAPLALISHAPCGVGCAGSLELAERILAGIEAQEPGFPERWLQLSTALHVIDQKGRCLVMDVDGRLDASDAVHVRYATEVFGDSADSGLQGRPMPEMTGQSLRVVDGCLRGSSFSASLVADHRGSAARIADRPV